MEYSKVGYRRHRLSGRYGDRLVPSKQTRRLSGSRPKAVSPRSEAYSSSDSSSYSFRSPSPNTHYPPTASSSRSPEPNTFEIDQDERAKISQTCGAMDQQLLDNWCTATQQSLVQRNSTDRTWQTIIQRESPRYPALRHSKLALSALQLASTSEDGSPERNRHLQAARSHYTQAAELLASTTGPNAAFSAASILFMCGLASSTLAGEGSAVLISSHPNQTPTSPEKETDASPSSSLQKLLDQFETIRSLLPTSEVLDTVETGDLKDPFTQGDPYHQLPNTYTLTVLAMKNLNAASAKKDPSHETAVYNAAISTLDKALEMLTKGGDLTMIALRWMYRVPSRYLELVRAEQPLALTILAHYCAVLHHLRDRWWMGDLGTQLLKEICQLLGLDQMGPILWATDIVGIQT